MSRADNQTLDLPIANAAVPAGDTYELDNLRVALVHYWFTGQGGAERVMCAIGDIFPTAQIFTLVSDRDKIPKSLCNHRISNSFIGSIPGAHRWHRHLLALYPFALEQFDLSDFDLVISSESGPAKGVITSPRTCHICYCHSPMRYLWDMYHEYKRNMSPVSRGVFSLTAHYSRLWDFSTAARVDHFVANSKYVAARIQKYYRRDSTVIYPPVDVPGYVADDIGDYYLTVSRLVPYKRIDLAILACNKLHRKLRVIGAGPEYRQLKRIAGPTIEFLGELSDSEVHENLARCRALLFPGEEDFGIVPVEAHSFGRPVLAYARGGATETVKSFTDSQDYYDGILFAEQRPESLAETILQFESIEHTFSPYVIRARTQPFSAAHFKSEMKSFIETAYRRLRHTSA